MSPKWTLPFRNQQIDLATIKTTLHDNKEWNKGRHKSGYVPLKVIDRLPQLQQSPHATSWLEDEFVNNPRGISPLFRAYRGPSITGCVVQGDDSRKKGYIYTSKKEGLQTK